MGHIFEISEDIIWRKEQLLTVKTLPFKYAFDDRQMEYLLKYSIPNAYAIWEGFIQSSFQIYIREINNLSLDRNIINLNILLHCVERNFPQIREYPADVQKKIRFISKLESFFVNDFKVHAVINTQSNVGFDVLNGLLESFNLEKVPSHPFKADLEDLLRHRNRIAHGDLSFVYDKDDLKNRIGKFIASIENLMELLSLIFYRGLNETKSYLR